MQNSDNTEVLYDTSKIGTPAHRAELERNVDAVLKEFPHLNREQAGMLLVYRGTSKVATMCQNTSGGGRYPAYCAKIGVPY